MADVKISELTELTSANATTDILPVVDTSAGETKKIKLANLPISDAALAQSYPYTTDFITGTERTRNLTGAITISSGFYYNSNLSSVYVGTNVTSIETEAFRGCSSLTSITIPNSVTSIGSDAFQSCSSLTSITIPNSVTSIRESAFEGCSSLTSVTISDSVTTIQDHTFKGTSITSVTIPASVTTIGVGAFNGTRLTSVTIPASVFSIGNYAFKRAPLASVTILDGVKWIGNGTFSRCAKLTSVTIPASVTSIGSYAFGGTINLATINCLATTAPSIGSSAFYGAPATQIHVPVGATGYGSTYGGLTVVYDL